jgi:hypothetical protein
VGRRAPSEYLSQEENVAPSISIPSKPLELNTDDQIYLQADNGMYLSRINRGVGLNPIEAAKSGIDPNCRFVVTILDDLTIALQADNGMYLSWISSGDSDPIEAAKSGIDTYCHFRVLQLCSAQDQSYLALQAENGMYFSRISRGGLDPIEAAKSGVDSYSCFRVSRLS